MFDTYIDNLKNDIVKETCNLINIPSVSEENSNPDITRLNLDYRGDK